MTLRLDQNHASAGRAACCAAAAIAIGHALQFSGGTLNKYAVCWVAVGLVLAWGAVLLSWGRQWLVMGICLAGFLWQVWQLHIAPPMTEPWEFHRIALPIIALGGAAAICGSALLRKIGLPLLCVTFLLTGAMVIHLAPRPFIDVFEVTQDSCRALLHGRDPYAIDFQNIYTARPDWEKTFYPPGLVVNGRVNLGYPYMPIGLGLDEIGYMILGDYRYGNLLAVAVAGALLGYASKGWAGSAAAAILLTTPQGFFVLLQGWADPVIVLMLAATVFCAMRRSPKLPWVFGLLMASKQHMFLAAPAALLLLPRPWTWRTTSSFFLKAAIVASVVTIPLALWNFHAFWHSAVEVQLKNPFRYDSLSFSAAWAHLGHSPPSSLLGFAAAIIAAAIAVWRGARTPAGFAAGVAVIYLSLFVLAKQAFCNYYFLSIGMLCCSLAAWE